MAKLATANMAKVKVSDVEFGLSKPSYTIDTMRFLQRNYPGVEWSIILGEDSIASFPRWKAYDELLRDFEIMIFPRQGAKANLRLTDDQKLVQLFPTPLINISSTEIRKKCANKENISALVSHSVENFIRRKGLYL